MASRLTVAETDELIVSDSTIVPSLIGNFSVTAFSITCTLSRTIYTSVTTLIMLAALFALGVASVKEFTLPLIVGIVVGAYSSICLTSAMWYVMGGKKRGITDAAKKAQEEKKKKASADGAQV